MKKILSIGMAVCVIFAMVSCGGGGGGGKAPETWTIAYNANGWEGDMPSPLTVKIPRLNADGQPNTIGGANLPALDETETQRFLGWALTPGQDQERVLASYVPTKDIILYVQFQELIPAGDPVNITYDANGWEGEDFADLEPTVGVSGEGIGEDNLPTLADTATQVFLGWSLTPGQTGAVIGASTVLRGHTKLYVRWAGVIVLSFDYNFTTDEPNPPPVQVGQGAAIGDVLPEVEADFETSAAVIRPTHLFSGWFTEREGGTKATEASTFNVATTLYAQWELLPDWEFFNMDLSMIPEGPASTPGNQWPAARPTVVENSDGSINVTFNDNNQRLIIMLTPGQRAILANPDVPNFRMMIDGEVVSATPPAANSFRYFIGNPNIGANWNGTTGNGPGTFESLADQTVTFNSNRFRSDDGSDQNAEIPEVPEPEFAENWRTQALILQVRAAGTVVLKINNIRIRYDENLGGVAPAPAFKVDVNLNYPSAPPAVPNFKALEAGNAFGILPATPTRALYTFTGWFTASTGGTEVTETAPTFNTASTIYAQWEKLATATITFDLNYPSAPAGPEAKEILEGAAIGTLPTASRLSYNFLGWFDDAGAGTQVTATTTFDADATVYAHWEYNPVTYDVTFVYNYTGAPNNGTFEVVGNVPHGGSVSALPTTDPTRTGFAFAGWATTAAGGTPFTTSTPVEAPTTVYAQWTFVGTPGELVEFYLDLTNIATTQYAPAKAADWQWVPELATPITNQDGSVTFAFDNTKYGTAGVGLEELDGDNAMEAGSDKGTRHRQNAFILLTAEQAAYLSTVNANGINITVEVAGSKSGTTAFRWGFADVPSTASNWDRSALGAPTFNTPQNLARARAPAAIMSFIIQMNQGWMATDSITISSIKVSFTQPTN